MIKLYAEHTHSLTQYISPQLYSLPQYVAKMLISLLTSCYGTSQNKENRCYSTIYFAAQYTR
jgi:hypothetical protein